MPSPYSRRHSARSRQPSSNNVGYRLDAEVGASRRLASVSEEVTLVETNGLGHNRIIADDDVGAQIVDFLGDRSRTAPVDRW